MQGMIEEIAARLVSWAGIEPGPEMTRWGEPS
jgi:4-hydroxy-3-polyprenylbenzoate decarboxylase